MRGHDTSTYIGQLKTLFGMALPHAPWPSASLALMRSNTHPGGNMAILVQAPARGLRNLQETLEYLRQRRNAA